MQDAPLTTTEGRKKKPKEKVKNLAIYKNVVNGKVYWRVTTPKAGGGRTPLNFNNYSEAKATYDRAFAKLKDSGLRAFEMTEEDRIDARQAYEILVDFETVSLTEAAQFFVDHHKRITGSETVAKAVTALLASKQTKRQRYRQDLKNRLARFVEDFGDRKMADIHRSEVVAWLTALNGKPVTRDTFRLRLSALWQYARLQGWATQNLIEEIPTERKTTGSIGILSVDELSKLLSTADPKTLPYWVLGAFCGLRSAELGRLEWKDIKWQSKLVEVPSLKSKTASRRFVRLRANVLKWLSPYRAYQGQLCPGMLRKRLERDRTNAGLKEWKPNCLRHSFCSYALAKEKNAKALALEMGHSDSDLLFKNYRELVLPSEAKKYWQLVPDAAAQKKVVMMAAA